MLEPSSALRVTHTHTLKTYKGVGVVSEIEVHAVLGLLHDKQADGAGRVAVLDAWVTCKMLENRHHVFLAVCTDP